MRMTLMQGEELGRLVAESILKEAGTEAEFRHQVAAFEALLAQIVELKRQQEGEAVAAAFDQGARTAVADRLVLYADQAKQGIQWKL